MHRRGGGTVPCASPACVQKERRAGEARRVVNRGAGVAKPRRRGEQKGEVRTVPPAPPPAFAQRVGEGARVRRVARKPEEGEQPGQRRLLANRKGGGTLCPPCPKRACKGGGGRGQGGVQPGWKGLLPANRKEGWRTVRPAPRHARKGEGGAGQ